LSAFRGILNSTTNLILTLMEDGLTFEEALGQAQTMGIAETDPSGDLEGWDAAVKVAALTTVLMDQPLDPSRIQSASAGREVETAVPGRANFGRGPGLRPAGLGLRE